MLNGSHKFASEWLVDSMRTTRIILRISVYRLNGFAKTNGLHLDSETFKVEVPSAVELVEHVQ